MSAVGINNKLALFFLMILLVQNTLPFFSAVGQLFFLFLIPRNKKKVNSFLPQQNGCCRKLSSFLKNSLNAFRSGSCECVWMTWKNSLMVIALRFASV